MKKRHYLNLFEVNRIPDDLVVVSQCLLRRQNHERVAEDSRQQQETHQRNASNTLRSTHVSKPSADNAYAQ